MQSTQRVRSATLFFRMEELPKVFGIFFCMEDLSLVSHLLIYSIIYLYQYRPMDIYFIFWVRIWYCLIYFVAQIVLALATGSSYSGLCPLHIGLQHVLVLLSCFLAL